MTSIDTGKDFTSQVAVHVILGIDSDVWNQRAADEPTQLDAGGNLAVWDPSLSPHDSRTFHCSEPWLSAVILCI